MTNPSVIGGLKIIESIYLTEYRQKFIPRTKKKRIQQKARRNPRNWAVLPSEFAYQMNGGIVMHPVMAAKLRESLAQGGRLPDAGGKS